MKLTESQLRRIVRRIVSESTSPDQVDAAIQRFKTNPRIWNSGASNDFYIMAAGGDGDGIRDQYYPDWSDEDFISVIVGVDGAYEP